MSSNSDSDSDSSIETKEKIRQTLREAMRETLRDSFRESMRESMYDFPREALMHREMSMRDYYRQYSRGSLRNSLRESIEDDFYGISKEKRIEIQKQRELEEKDYETGRVSPPLLSNYRRQPSAIQIGELWKEQKKSERIVIFIRGPPYCGKSYISRKIAERELISSRKPVKVSIINGGRNGNEFFSAEKLSEDYRRAVRDRDSFIVVEVKFLRFFKEFVEIAGRARYEMYVINLWTSYDGYNNYLDKCSRRSEEIRKTISDYLEQMRKDPLPHNMTILDPLELQNRDFREKTFFLNFTPKGNFTPQNYCEEDLEIARVEVKAILEDPVKVAKFKPELKNSINFEQEAINVLVNLIKESTLKPKSALDNYLDNLPDLLPSQVIEYNHKHRQSLEDSFEEFVLTRVYDYNHRRNQQLVDITDEVDLEVVEEKERNKRQKEKQEWYVKQQSVCTSDLESNPSYPKKNWEKVEEVEREKPRGKRYKRMRTKIRNFLANQIPKEVTVVQKRVKRLKIDDKISEPTPKQPEEVSTRSANFHIQHLLSSTTLTNVDEANKLDFLDYIKSFYERLYKIQEFSAVLQILVQADFLEIEFNFSEVSGDSWRSHINKIAIFTHNKTETEIVAILAAQMMRAAISLVFANNEKPFREGDDDRKEELERILFDIEYRFDENHNIMKEMLQSGDEKHWNVQVLPRVTQITILDAKEKFAGDYEKLWNFYSQTLTDIQRSLKKFDNCTRMCCISPGFLSRE